MKKDKIIFLLSMLVLSTFFACQKDFNERYLLTDNNIEFEDAATTTVAVGKNYPIVTRTISPTNTEVSFQVNLSGSQFSEDQTLAFRIVDSETTSVEGRDFTIAGGKTFVLAKGSSKGSIKIQALGTGVGSTLLVLELVGNDKIKMSKNYSRVALRCIYP